MRSTGLIQIGTDMFSREINQHSICISNLQPHLIWLIHIFGFQCPLGDAELTRRIISQAGGQSQQQNCGMQLGSGCEVKS